MSSQILAQHLLPILAASCLTVATTSLFIYWLRNRKNFVNVCKVKKLVIYPIKALKGIEVNALEITDSVVKYGKFRDRSWVLLDRGDQCIKLLHEPKLALTKCSFHNENQLYVEAPDMPVLKLQYIEDLTNCRIVSFKMYGKEMSGIDCGEDAHKWFTTFLDRPDVRLVQHHPSFTLRDSHTHHRLTNDSEFRVIYQNKSSLHLVNESSVNDLNTHFSDGSERVVYENFRPNVVVDYHKPWDEDMWKYMSINGVNFVRLILCDRCPNTTVNPRTGIIGQESLIALNKFRPPTGVAKKKGLRSSLGVIFGHISQGVINTGDQIRVIYGKYELN